MSKPTSPEQLHRALADAFNARDLSAVLALYTPDGALYGEQGKASGNEQLAAALQQFFQLPGDMTVETVFAVEHQGLALARSKWSVVADGKVTAAASGVEIMRRHDDGTWSFIVDHPFGAQ